MSKKNKIKIATMMLLLILIDQISKSIVQTNLMNQSILIIPKFLKFTYVKNTGIAFGLGAESVILIIFFNIFILGVLGTIWCKKRKELLVSAQLSIAIIMAGGIGNLIDRIFRGYVIDFIDISQIIDYPVFNIADICVVVGFLIIIGTTMINIVKEQEKGQE